MKLFRKLSGWTFLFKIKWSLDRLNTQTEWLIPHLSLNAYLEKDKLIGMRGGYINLPDSREYIYHMYKFQGKGNNLFQRVIFSCLWTHSLAII